MNGTQTDTIFDIFISYAHGDNKQGWVTQFHKKLEDRLTVVQGREPHIFRDPGLGGVGESLSKSLKSRVENTNFLLSIVSPLYLNSLYCTDERETFLTHFGKDEGVKRIIRVDKLPADSLPTELEEKYGYRFYEEDTQRRTALELNAAMKKFVILINNLAFDIRNQIEVSSGLQSAVDTGINNTIYLAESAFDLEDERNDVKIELEKRGYHILPDKPLSKDPDTLKKSIQEHLTQSFLSIHLVAETYGEIPANCDQSKDELQFQFASELGKKKKLATIVWMPEEKNFNPKKKQKKFVQVIENDEHIDDLIKQTIEEFKTEVMDVIQNFKNGTNGEQKDVVIYLYYNKKDCQPDQLSKDTNHINELRCYLFEKLRYTVWVPDYSGSEKDVKESTSTISG